jgi:hypothetical protein
MKNLPIAIRRLPKDVLHVVTGNLLGDGYLQPGSTTANGLRKGNTRFFFFSVLNPLLEKSAYSY